MILVLFLIACFGSLFLVPWFIVILYVPCYVGVLFLVSRSRLSQSVRGSYFTYRLGWMLTRIEFDSNAKEVLERLNKMLGRQFMFAAEPHGLFCWQLAGLFAGYGGRLPAVIGENVFVMAHWLFVFLPVVNIFYALYGIVPSWRGSVERELLNGKHIALCPSGMFGKELSLSGIGASADTIAIHKRTNDSLGFIKMAIEYNLLIVPILSLHEDNTYERFNPLPISSWFTFSYGAGGIITPNCKKMVVRMGEPIDAGRYVADKEGILKLANRYYAQLETLARPDFSILFQETAPSHRIEEKVNKVY